MLFHFVFRNFQTSYRPRIFGYFHASFAPISPRTHSIDAIRPSRKRKHFIFHLRVVPASFRTAVSCTKKQLSLSLASSVFIRNVTKRQITERAIYIYICIYTHTHMQARHLRNHVSVPLLRSHACSSPQFPRASIEKRFHGAMLAILASIGSFHPLVPRSSLFPTLSRIFKSGMETRTNFPSRNRWPISYGYIYIYIYIEGK